MTHLAAQLMHGAGPCAKPKPRRRHGSRASMTASQLQAYLLARDTLRRASRAAWPAEPQTAEVRR